MGSAKRKRVLHMNRRHFMKHVAGYSALALPGIEFVRTIKANAQSLRAQNKSVIILWMGAAPRPSTSGTSSPAGHRRRVQGDHRPRPTASRSASTCRRSPSRSATWTIIRSLTTTEGDHMRGTQLMHTAYTPNPAIAVPVDRCGRRQEGSGAGRLSGHLPAELRRGRRTDGGGPGFLGMNYAPFTVQNPGTPPRTSRRAGLARQRHRSSKNASSRRHRLFH